MAVDDDDELSSYPETNESQRAYDKEDTQMRDNYIEEEIAVNALY